MNVLRWLLRPAGGRWAVLLRVLLVVWGLVAAFIAVRAPLGPISDRQMGPVMLVFNALGAAAAGRTARLRSLDPRTRRAWRYMTGGYCLLLVSCLLFAFVPGFPGPGDLPRMLAVPFLLLGLLSLTNVPRTRNERIRIGLDIGVVVAGSAMALWYWSLGPIMTTHGAPLTIVAVAAAYPVADLVLVFGAAAALQRGASDSTRRPLAFAVLGSLTLVAGDLQHARGSLTLAVHGLRDGSASAPATQWLSLITAFCLLTCAAVEQCAGAAAPAPTPSGERAVSRITLLPYLAIAGGYGLLLVVAVRAALFPWGGLIVGAVVMTALVVARQVLVLHENHQLVVTDSLTRVATRPALTLALSRALARQGRADTVTAVLLIDMDGFKQVNDELGHEAGDDLLVGFAGLLRGAVGRTDTVGRLGGDEFAAVLTDIADPDDAVAVALRLLDAMRAPLPIGGRLLVPRASIGVALSQPGDSTRTLMHRADQAMYRAKREGGGWCLDISTNQPDRPDLPSGALVDADG